MWTKGTQNNRVFQGTAQLHIYDDILCIEIGTLIIGIPGRNFMWNTRFFSFEEYISRKAANYVVNHFPKMDSFIICLYDANESKENRWKFNAQYQTYHINI